MLKMKGIGEKSHVYLEVSGNLIMLNETEKILTKFRELNRKHFYETARDFVPSDPLGYREGCYYGYFDEAEEIYTLMYTLHLQLDEQIFFGYYNNAYSSPFEPIKALKELNNYLKGHIERLKELNEKYHNQLFPVKCTLDLYLKTQTTVEYVLTLPEIKNVVSDPEQNKIKDEIIDIKTKQGFRGKQFKILVQLTFYILCLFIPVFLIIVLWNDHRNGKWFQLGLVLFPIISFLYDKAAFIEIFKFSFSKNYRLQVKENLKKKVSENYR